MKSSHMNCERALAVLLVEDTDEEAHGEALRARLHVNRCSRCSSPYDHTDHDERALWGLAERGTTAAGSLRIGLIVVAVAQLVCAIPWLVGRSVIPDSQIAVSHLTRDGALGCMIAALGLATAWRPRYVHCTMLLGLLVFALQFVAGVADQQTGAVNVSFEFVHLLVVLIVFGMFGIAANMARRATPRAEPRSLALHGRSRAS